MTDTNLDNHFRDLFENTSDLMYFLNIDGSVILANTAWATTLEYDSDEVIGRSIYDFIHPDYLEAYKVPERM